MKTIRIILTIIIITLSLSGCKSNSSDFESIQTPESTASTVNQSTTHPSHIPEGFDFKKPTPDPEPLDDVTAPDPTESNLVMETHYGDNIIFKMNQNEYSLDAEEVKGTVINTNPGVCFRFFRFPLLERYCDGNWVRLACYEPGIFFEEMRWLYALSSENPETEKGLVLDLSLKYVYEKLTPGKYRLVAFIGDQKYYAEFEFVE